MKTYIFPGQGSQAKGMGGDLFDRFPELTQKADEILGYSIKALCLEDSRNELNQTQFTQPALFVVNALSYAAKIEQGQRPDYVAGHSLGEFNALLAAECFDFESGLQLVKKRGELMGQASGGGMAAVLNASKEEVEDILHSNGLHNLHLANYNTPSQIVISGLASEINQARKFFKKDKIRYVPLNTSGAFHSPFMREAMEEFKVFIQEMAFQAPKIPVIANVTARPYSSETMGDTLASQIADTVRWCESIQYLLAVAEKEGQPMEFEEVGHGDVLIRLVEAIKQQTTEEVLRHLNLSETDAPQSTQQTKQALVNSGLRSATEKVIAWNAANPVGTKVKSALMADVVLETRTEAVVLFGHRAAVYVQGFNGYFDLDEVTLA